MRYVATYLLAVLGGNTNPSAQDIRCILGSVGIEANDEHLSKVVGELNGKDINKVISSGLTRLASVPAGGGGVGAAIAAPPPAASAAVGLAAAAVEEKEEKDDSEGSDDDDMGFGLFD